jgi:hypothetical protein
MLKIGSSKSYGDTPKLSSAKQFLTTSSALETKSVKGFGLIFFLDAF